MLQTILDAGIYDLLIKTLLDLTGFYLVLGVDFNAVWDSNINRKGGAENRDQHLVSDVLCQWAAHTGMTDIWRLMKPSIRDYSFFSGRHRSFSRLDFLFFNSSLMRDETYKSQFKINFREFLRYNKGLVSGGHKGLY